METQLGPEPIVERGLNLLRINLQRGGFVAVDLMFTRGFLICRSLVTSWTIGSLRDLLLQLLRLTV